MGEEEVPEEIKELLELLEKDPRKAWERLMPLVMEYRRRQMGEARITPELRDLLGEFAEEMEERTKEESGKLEER